MTALLLRLRDLFSGKDIRWRCQGALCFLVKIYVRWKCVVGTWQRVAVGVFIVVNN